MNLQLKIRRAQNNRSWLTNQNDQAVLEFALILPIVRNVTEYVTQKTQETYQVAKTVYDTVVEKVPQMVKETYEYMKPINTARMETAQAIRELPDQVTKKIDEITPKNGPLASKVGFNVGLAGVAMGAVAMVVSTFITPVETANAITQGLTNTAQNVGRYIEKAAQEPGLILQDGKKLVNASVEWMQNSSDYEKGKLTGQVAGEAGLLLVGAGEAKAGLKTAELAETVATKTALKEAGAMTKGMGSVALKIPQGLSAEKFSEVSKMIRSEVSQISDDVFVQGSRASGATGPVSDIDFAVRVSPNKFEQLAREAYGNPLPGTPEAEYLSGALEKGIIHSRPAGLRVLEKALKEKLGMEVDVSIIKMGGQFDKGLVIPLK